MSGEFTLIPAWLWQQSAQDFLLQVKLSDVLKVLVVLAGAPVLIRFLGRYLDRLSQKGVRLRYLVKWLQPVVRLGIWFLAILLSVQFLAPTQSAFFAVFGSMALAIGLGAQDLIKNLIGGFVILTDRPYQVGDRVSIGDAYGEVASIGLRSTKLVTLDDRRVTIPNSAVLDGQVSNANYGEPDEQVVTEIFLPAKTDPELALRIGYEAAWTSPYVYSAKPVAVVLADEYSETPYMRLRIKAYVFEHRYENALRTDVTTRAKKELLRQGLLDAWPAGG